MKSTLTAALLTLSMLWTAGVVAATGDELPTASELYAQAGDPAVVAPTATPTAVAEEPPAAAAFATDQLEQLVAPIALYPDALLMQILMASTYPLEIVEAERWLSQQPGLKDDALDKALLEKDWDPSVKSLCTLPDVLKRMSENLDWTQDLGDAFLAQQNDILDTVQRMRGKAYEAGNLESTEQQKVTQNADKIIVIESSSPEVVYVPTYSPTVVYGASWGYPSYYYPPMYPYYPPGYGLVSFGVGVAVGAALWGGCNWGWGNNDVNIDIDRHNEFNRNTNINADRDRGDRGQGSRGQGGKEGWNHDSSHRKGVNYKDSGVAQKYGAGAGSNRVTKDQARGRQSGATASNRAGGTQQGNRQAAGTSNRAGTGAQQGNRQASGASNRASSGAQQKSSSAASSSARSSQANRSKSGSSSAYSGSRSPSSDRMSSSRGASSRGASSYGGSRGGGGGRGGGGRRR